MNFTKQLIDWYHHHKRDLPWRHTRDPYKIWVSEIILQQTRIEQGTGYYYRFLDRFGTLQELAAATEKKVLKTWQGLGYYTRALNMHATAREIVETHHGIFPDDYDAIRQLKGIGPYTAAAIASLAFNLPYPVIDGNVLRFLSRYFGIAEPVDQLKGRKAIGHLAGQWMDRKDPGTYNQALMEFGALQCVPKNPDCRICPLKRRCFAFMNGQTHLLPVRSKSRNTRTRYFNYLVIVKGDISKAGKVWLRKRTGDDVWKNLYDFPLIESDRELTEKQLRLTRAWKSFFAGNKSGIVKKSGPFRHVLTHQVILANFYFIEAAPGLNLPFREIPVRAIEKYPMSRLMEKFVKNELIKS